MDKKIVVIISPPFELKNFATQHHRTTLLSRDGIGAKIEVRNKRQRCVRDLIILGVKNEIDVSLFDELFDEVCTE